MASGSGPSSHRGSAIAVDRMAADSPSDFSDTSSVDSMSVGGRGGASGEHSLASQQHQQMPPSPASRDQFGKRIESLQQENRVLKIEVETCKMRIKSLQDENKHLRQTSCEQQARAEAEEEYISNTLMKKITTLKKEKEKLACSYEQEEQQQECLTNQLSRKLNKLRQEKVDLEQSLEKEQEVLVNRLMKRIHKLENEVRCKQQTLDQLRREKVELENSLEQEQEALVNKLWIRMHKLEEEKRMLQEQLQLPSSAPQSPCATPGIQHHSAHAAAAAGYSRGSGGSSNAGSTSSLAGTNQAHATAAAIVDNENKRHIELLRAEVARLKRKLSHAEKDHTTSMNTMSNEERQLREENMRLHRKLQLEFTKQKSFTGGSSGSAGNAANSKGVEGGAGAAGLGSGSASAGGGGVHHGLEAGSMSVSESEHSLDDQYNDSLGGEDLLNSGPPSNNSNVASAHTSHSLSTNPNLRRQRGRADSETSYDRGAAGDRAPSGGNANSSNAGGGNSGGTNVPMSPAYSVQASPRSVFHAPSPVYVGNSSSTSGFNSQAPYLLGIHGPSSVGASGNGGREGSGTGANTPGGTHPPQSPMDTASIRSCESPLASFNSSEFPAVPEPPPSTCGSSSQGNPGGGIYQPVTKRQFVSASAFSNIAKSGRQTPTPSPSSSSAPSPMATNNNPSASLAGNAAVVQQQQQNSSSTSSTHSTLPHAT